MTVWNWGEAIKRIEVQMGHLLFGVHGGFLGLSKVKDISVIVLTAEYCRGGDHSIRLDLPFRLGAVALENLLFILSEIWGSLRSLHNIGESFQAKMCKEAFLTLWTPKMKSLFLFLLKETLGSTKGGIYSRKT